MKSCLVPLLGSFTTTGGIIFFGSEGNFIGNVSFEGNHAVENGGKEDWRHLFSIARSVNQVHATFQYGTVLRQR